MSFFYLFKQLWRYAESDRWKIVLNTIFHLLSFTGPLIQPYAFGKMIGSLEQFGLSNLGRAIRWLSIYIAGFAVFEIFHRSARHIQISSALHSRERFIIGNYRILNRLPISWHNDHHSGDVVNRINHAGESLEEFGVVTENYLEQVVQTAGPIVILTALSWEIALITLGVGAAIFLIALKMNRMIHPILTRQKEALHTYHSRIFDYVSNIKTIITLRRGAETGKELVRRFRKYSSSVLRENKINQVRCFVLALGAILIEIVVLLYYLRKCKNGLMVLDVGFMVIVAGYVRQISDSLFSLASGFYDLLRQRAACESSEPITKAERMSTDRDAGPSIHWKQIRIEGLTFGYNTESPVLNKLDITLTSGARTAVVGYSGCGKTTLLSVLRGLYPATTERVSVDGKGGDDLAITEHISTLFPQSPDIFEHTILFNITFGVDHDVSRLERSIRISQFDRVLDRLPNDLQTDIRERGVNLSGGEQKRLALARGLYAADNSSIMLLDEPTANIDVHHAGLFYEQLFAAYPDKCILCTVHDLHLLPKFDRILVLDSGTIAESGTYNELCVNSSVMKTLLQHGNREATA